MRKEEKFLSIGPSAPSSKPFIPTWAANSYFRLLADRILRSKTPLRAFPYSAGKAPVKKSELVRRLLFKILIGPPLAPKDEKWLGFGISIPSSRHNTPRGEFPRITI